MQQPVIRLFKLPFEFWRHPRSTTRRWRSRRRWPSPADFERMSNTEFEAYLVAIGFDAQIKASLATSEFADH